MSSVSATVRTVLMGAVCGADDWRKVPIPLPNNLEGFHHCGQYVNTPAKVYHLTHYLAQPTLSDTLSNVQLHCSSGCELTATCDSVPPVPHVVWQPTRALTTVPSLDSILQIRPLAMRSGYVRHKLRPPFHHSIVVLLSCLYTHASTRVPLHTHTIRKPRGMSISSLVAPMLLLLLATYIAVLSLSLTSPT